MAMSTASQTIESDCKPHETGFGQIPKIAKWLNFVDKQLPQKDAFGSTEMCKYKCNNSVEYLKFGLYTEIPNKSLASLENPSEIFYELLGCDNYKGDKEIGDEEKTLQVIVHSCRNIGRRFRGEYVVSQLTTEKFNLQEPSPLKQNEMSQEFFLFQCLSKVALVVSDETAGKIMKHFAKSKALEKNYRNIKHLLDLFTQMYQARLISAQDTACLEALLEKFQESDGVHLLKMFRQGSAEFTLSGLSSKSGPSFEQSELLPIETKKGNTEGKTRSDPNPTIQDLVDLSSDEQGHSVCDEADNEEHRIGTQHGHQQSSVSVQCLKIVLLFPLILILLLILGLSFGLLWKPLYQAKSTTKVGYVNETIILCMVDHLYHSHIQISRNIEIEDSPLIFEFHLIDRPCKSLPTKSEATINITNGLSFGAEHNFTEYFMPRSYIKYEISATSSYSEPEWMQITLKRFLLKQEKTVVHKVVHIGPKGEWINTRFEYHVPPNEWDYYSLMLDVPNDSNYNYTYNATVNKVKIDTSDHNSQNCTIDYKNENNYCSVAVGFKTLHRVSCLLATNSKQTNSLHHHTAHITTSVEYSGKGLTLTLVPIGLVMLLLIIAEVVCCFYSCKKSWPCLKSGYLYGKLQEEE